MEEIFSSSLITFVKIQKDSRQSIDKYSNSSDR